MRARLAYRLRPVGAVAAVVLALLVVRNLMLGGASVLSLLVAAGVLR